MGPYEPDWSCDGTTCHERCCKQTCSGVLPTLCSDHGTVTGDSFVSGCSCDCAHGYSGAICQDGPCDSLDCSGHGEADGLRQIGCTCKTCDVGVEGYPNAKWGGDHCGIPPCTKAEDCNGRGTPSGSRGACSCVCDAGYSGAFCDTGPCGAEDCNHRGLGHGSKGACEPCTNCQDGYSGSQCEIGPCTLAWAIESQLGQEEVCDASGTESVSGTRDACSCN